MLECKQNTAPELPKGQEVLIKYAEDGNGLNASFTPSSTLNYISFSTDGGKTWSAWKLYAGSTSGGSASGSGLLFGKYGTYILGTGVGSYNGFTDGAYVLKYTDAGGTIVNAGESYEVEALFKLKNTNIGTKKIAIQFTSGTASLLFDYTVKETGTSVPIYFTIKGKLVVNSIPTDGYYMSELTNIGTPNIIIGKPINSSNLLDVANTTTIMPVGDNVGGSIVVDLVTCVYFNVYKK